MGNLFSTFGFNQPFLIALTVIIVILLVTAILVGKDEPQKSNDIDQRYNDITTPCITIHNPLIGGTTKSCRNVLVRD